MEKKDESIVGGVLFAWVANTISVLYWAVIIKIVWNWNLPPAFAGAHRLSYVHAVGISLLIAIGIVALRKEESENPGWQKGKWFIVEAIAHSAWILAVASVFHYLL